MEVGVFGTFWDANEECEWILCEAQGSLIRVFESLVNNPEGSCHIHARHQQSSWTNQLTSYLGYHNDQDFCTLEMKHSEISISTLEVLLSPLDYPHN